MKKFLSLLVVVWIIGIAFSPIAGAQCSKPVVISNAATVCTGAQTTLFTQATPGLTYQWSTGAITSSIIAGVGTYTVTTTDAAGCSQTSDPIVIKEKTAPAVIPSGAPELCPGESLTLFADTGNVWHREAGIPTVRHIAGVSLVIGSKGYAGGGYNGAIATYYNDWWEFDEGSGTWTQKADIPGGGRAYATSFALNNKGYVALGSNSTSRFGDLQEYDPFTNSWTVRAGYPGGNIASPVSFTAGSLAYVGLGQSSSGYPLNFWSYNPASDQWTPVAPFPATGRRESVGFGINGKGYVTCGWNTGTANTNDCWQYDPVTNAWTAQAPVPGIGRRAMAAFTIRDHAYISCGVTTSGNLNDLWEFYNGTWTRKAGYPGAVQWGTTALSFPDKGMMLFGSVNTNQVWTYHPNKKVTWPDGSVQPSFPIQLPGSYSARLQDISGCRIVTSTLMITPQNLAATITPSGPTAVCDGTPVTLSANGDAWTRKQNLPSADWYTTGFAIGTAGYYCGGAIGNNQCWKYDPATDTWSQQANLPMQINQAAAVIWNGKAYVLGSGDKTIWMYDPANDGWTRKATMTGAAQARTQGFLLNDQMIVAGGLGPASSVLAEVWAYDLINDTWTRKNDMPYGMAYSAAFAVNGKGYLCTGNSTRGGGTAQSAVCLQYDLAADSWTVLPDFPGGLRGGGLGFTDGNKAYVGMGNRGAILNDLWQLDPATLTWSRMQDIPIGRYGALSFVIGHKAYVGTGAIGGGNRGTDFWEYEMPYHYLWSNGATTRSIQVTITNNYSVTVSNDEGCSTVSAPEPVTIYLTTKIPRPLADVAVCEGGFTLFALPASGTNLVYQWRLNGKDLTDGGIYKGTDTWSVGIWGATGPAAGLYDCVVTGLCGTKISTAARLIVHALPSKPVITPGSALAFCVGGTVTLTSPAAAIYNWSTGAATQQIVATQPGAYTLQITDANNCRSPLSDAVTVQVNPLPAKPVISTGGPLTFCAGDKVALTAPAAAVYNWSTGDATQQIMATQAGPYTLQIRDANGCQSPLSDAVTVQVNPLPAKPVITAGSATSFCEGGNVTLSGPAAAAWSWSTGALTQQIITTRPGAYTLQVTDANNCRSAASDPVIVQVNPLPAGTITTTGPLLSGNTHIMQLTAPLAAGGQYAWSTGANIRTILVSQSGNYSVLVTTAQGCRQTFRIPVQLIDLSMVPNTFSPNRDGVNDYWYVKSLDAFSNAVVQIFNRNGSKVYEAKGAGIKWDGTSNGRDLPAGVYFYVLDLKDGSQAINGWINLLR
jgi:gliding motility-associated-like protein